MSRVTQDIRSVYRNSDALALSALVKRREVKPSELMEAAIAAAEELNPMLNALVSTNYDDARVRAAQSDSMGAFSGIPYVAKNLAPTEVAGFTTTHGSRFYHRHARPSTQDCEVIVRARKAGFIPFGMTNTPENGTSWTTESQLYGAARNPWNTSYTTGGSSGGSAAAVAARIVPIADAADGGGSIRLPASACGLVGLKPSRGRIPLYPLLDYWYGSVVSGCVSRTVRDTAAYLDVVSGSCVGDPYTPPARAESFLDLSLQAPRPLRIGFTTSLPGGHKLDPEVEASITDTAHILAGMAHNVEVAEFTFNFEACFRARLRVSAVQAALQFQLAEAAFGATLADDDVEPSTRAYIEQGKVIDAVTHALDIETVRRAGRDIAADLARFDAFLCPVIPLSTFRIGEWSSIFGAKVEFSKHMEFAAFLVPINVGGLPAISLPVHQSVSGLPVGVQLVGRYGDEATLLQVANALERELHWDQRKPPGVDRNDVQ